MNELLLKYIKGETDPIEAEEVLDLLIEEDEESQLFMEIFWISGPEVKLLNKERSSRIENSILNRINVSESRESIPEDSYQN